MGVMVSSSHIVSADPSSLRGGLLTLFPCSSMWSLSLETVLHKLPQRESIPQAAALQDLPPRGSLPWGAVLQERAAPAWVPHRVSSPASKPAPAWVPLSMGLQVLARACSSAGSPRGYSFLQASTCSGMGSLPRATGEYLLHCGPSCTAGGQPASPWSFILSCKTVCSGVSSTSSPLLFTDRGVCRVVSLTPSHPSFPTAVSCRFFLPLLEYVITEALPRLLIGLALASGGSILEPAGIGSIRHGGSFSQLLTEATPTAAPLPKPCHSNPQQHFKILDKLGNI